MKRPRTLVWLAIASAAFLAACGRAPATSSQAAVHRVVCTTFPMFLFTSNVVAGRDAVAVDSMLPAAMGCPHDYVLTPQDMQKIAGADLLVANGLGMEAFLGEPIARANPRIRVVDASRRAGEILWMAGERAGDAGASVPNPHMFSSPRLAARIARHIAAALSGMDPQGAALYTRNADQYARRLEAVAAECEAVSGSLRSRKIVTVHAVFDYFARDCGFEIAAVVEEAPGQEPAAARMLELVSLIRRTGAAALFTEPQYPVRVGQTLAREAGIPDAVLDPVASGPDAAPLDYYEQVMRANFATLARTLR